MRECKRYTACSVYTLCCSSWGTPPHILRPSLNGGGIHSQVWMEGGGVNPFPGLDKGTPRVPHCFDLGRGYPSPDLGWGYPLCPDLGWGCPHQEEWDTPPYHREGWGTPWSAGWGIPVNVNGHMPVKTLPLPFLWNAGSNKESVTWPYRI